jgi:hypothetical protein
VGILTEAPAANCGNVTATDIGQAALDETDARLSAAGRRQHVRLQRTSIDCAWPADDFDLVVLSELAYYLSKNTLRRVLDSEVSQLMPGTTVLAAHWPNKGKPRPSPRRPGTRTIDAARMCSLIPGETGAAMASTGHRLTGPRRYPTSQAR